MVGYTKFVAITRKIFSKKSEQGFDIHFTPDKLIDRTFQQERMTF